MAGTVCEIICAFLLPPVGVWMHTNTCGMQVLINILLCLLGYFPGIVHALIVICVDKKDKPAANSSVPMGGQPGTAYPQPANASAPHGYPAAQPAAAAGMGGSPYPPPQATQPAGYPAAAAAGTAAQGAPYPPASAV